MGGMKLDHNRAGYLINQRVVVEDEIGTINQIIPRKGCVWVFLPSKGYASEFDLKNVKPLPNGQL